LFCDFAYLPGLLSGLGVSANYSHTWSQVTGVSPLRNDSPALLRQAPNTWNISPTYDRGRLSIRVGLAYNGANIFQYAYKPFLPDGTPNPNSLGGLHGPTGDQYLYSHFQVDAQGSFRIRRGSQLHRRRSKPEQRGVRFLQWKQFSANTTNRPTLSVSVGNL
jgi:hypothetical protein